MIAMPDEDGQRRDRLERLERELHAIETAHGRLGRHPEPAARPLHALSALDAQPTPQPITRRVIGPLSVFASILAGVGAFVALSALIALVLGNLDGLSGLGAVFTRYAHVPPFLALFLGVVVVSVAEAVRSRAQRHR